MYTSLLAAVLACAGSSVLVVASPNQPPPKQGFCKQVESAITHYHQQSAATAFCSSYLSITPSTKTVTRSTTETTTTGTTTVTKTVSLSDCAIPPTSEGMRKRRAPTPRAPSAVPKPSALNGYQPSSVLSSACKCLSIHPSSTATTTTTTTRTTKVEATATSTATLLQIDFILTEANDAEASADVESNGHVDFGVTNAATPSHFILYPNGTLLDDNTGSPLQGQLARVSAKDPYQLVTFGAKGSPIHCSFTHNAAGECPMTCEGAAGSDGSYVQAIDNGDDYVWGLRSGASTSGEAAPYAIPITSDPFNYSSNGSTS